MILVLLIVLGVAIGCWAAWAIHRTITCHGQCPYDRSCQARCLQKGYCPAENAPEWLQPAVQQ